MRYALSPAGRRELARFAARDVLLAFDFDGTLAPIARTPDRARMRALTRERLQALARLHPCVVITGRARKDALRQLRGLGLRMVVGNHGLETIDSHRHASPWLRRLLPRLSRSLGHSPGVWVEDKGYSLTIHYRLADDARKARRDILAAVGVLRGLRVIEGKRSVNLLPAGAPGKGLALERERIRLGCAAAVYVGDDETDEDVYARASGARMLGIRVGRVRRSKAAWYLRRQSQIDELLLLLLHLHAGRGAGGARGTRAVRSLRAGKKPSRSRRSPTRLPALPRRRARA